MSSKPRPDDPLNPRTTTYEFLGPPGAFLVTIGVPAMSYALYFGCSETSGGCPPSLDIIPTRIAAAVTDKAWWMGLWDTQAFFMYVAWYMFCVVAWAVLPGDWIEGVQLRTGGKKQYKINAFSTFLLTLGITTGYIMRFGPQSFTFIYHKWVGFITAALVMSVVQALAVYVASFRKGALLAVGGNSGNPIYDFFIGRELNPSIGQFDIKSFNELRPGLILWVLVNISMLCEQAVRRGGLQNVTYSMWLVVAFQAFYVVDGLYNEVDTRPVFTTMDITTDGFGFMLAVGDLLWVPFVYSLQARYLAFNHVEFGPLAALGILAINALGYYIFRETDLQYFTTESGSKLLTSGWWGRSRHPNYFGDLVMALAWSLPTGFETPVTYFYVTYFAVLLIHRQRRDDEMCEKKYGKDWEKYKKMVPYRIIPYVY
ncbi:ergosterol biosynthesis ERG4/ERG24 [Pisolithus marmoratus]|nr:ergosterol biosynthesis ERG4/ERG24 [Pisolithus marmoratus]